MAAVYDDLGDYPDINKEVEVGFELQLRLLDDAHKRARTPSRRRIIELRARKILAQLEDIRRKAKLVDLAYERWVRSLERIAGKELPR